MTPTTHRLAPVYFATSITAVILVAATGSDGEKFGLSWRVPLTLLGVSSYIPWPDETLQIIWPVNGVTWSLTTMGFFYFSFPFLTPRLQRGVPAGQERVAAICLYLLQATWPLVIGFLFFPLRPGFRNGGNMWYWFVRAWPLCRFPVFMMGCLAAKLMIIQRQQTSVKFMCSNPTMCIKMADLCLIIYLASVVLYTLIATGVLGQSLKILTLPCRLGWEVLLPMTFFDWIIALCNETSVTRAFFSSTVMRWLGDISMSFYMIHLGVWVIAGQICNGKIPFDTYFTFGVVKTPAWLIPVCLSISILSGWLMTRFFEKPAQRMVLRRFL